MAIKFNSRKTAMEIDKIIIKLYLKLKYHIEININIEIFCVDMCPLWVMLTVSINEYKLVLSTTAASMIWECSVSWCPKRGWPRQKQIRSHRLDICFILVKSWRAVGTRVTALYSDSTILRQHYIGSRNKVREPGTRRIWGLQMLQLSQTQKVDYKIHDENQLAVKKLI